MTLSVPGGGPLRAHTETTWPPGDEHVRTLPSAHGKDLDPSGSELLSSPDEDPEPSGERPAEDAATFWSEHVHLRGAKALALYTGPYASASALSGLPAVTRNRYGAGTALYLSTRLADDAYARLLGLKPAPWNSYGVASGCSPSITERMRGRWRAIRPAPRRLRRTEGA